MNLRLIVAGLSLAGATTAGAAELSGQVRLQALERDGTTAEAEVRGDARAFGLAWNATGTARLHAGDSTAFLDEAYASTEAGSWAFAAGRRIVAWDVGYAFRPNDVVQQETRRTLLAVTPVGRTVLMAERFDADTAVAAVLVNPAHDRDARGADEPAVAARVYRRDGAVDWHGVARIGARTGPSVGGAFAWVATDSLELHGSARWMARADGLRTTRSPVQALLGGTWTDDRQRSVLLEAWWDGTALSRRGFDDWARSASPAARAMAGSGPSSLRRANVFLRLSAKHAQWEPAVDVLWMPGDGGHIATASLAWQGDRLRLDAGARWYGGPGDSLAARAPARRVAYAAATWAF